MSESFLDSHIRLLIEAKDFVVKLIHDAKLLPYDFIEEDDNLKQFNLFLFTLDMALEAINCRLKREGSF